MLSSSSAPPRLLTARQNKDKVKKGRLPDAMFHDKRYLAAATVPDFWVCYPWEAL